MATDENPTYSIVVRLQRTTTEAAFVRVLIVDDLVEVQPDGTGRLDGAKVFQRALEMGQLPDVKWQIEEQQVQPHPIQMAPPETADMDEVHLEGTDHGSN